MRAPVILLDVDGPLTASFFDTTCRFLRDEGVEAKPEHIDRWDIFAAFATPPHVEERVRERLCLPGIAKMFTPRPGAGPLVRALRDFGEVYAVTSPFDGSPTWAHDREAWLRDRLGFAADHVISARDKTLIAGDILVDDKTTTLVRWTAANPKGLAILWSETHNRADKWPGFAASNYVELMSLIGAFRGARSSTGI
ncbi:MAG: hypothetical protein ABI445_24165 [Polyangia bacterium]